MAHSSSNFAHCWQFTVHAVTFVKVQQLPILIWRIRCPSHGIWELCSGYHLSWRNVTCTVFCSNNASLTVHFFCSEITISLAENKLLLRWGWNRWSLRPERHIEYRALFKCNFTEKVERTYIFAKVGTYMEHLILQHSVHHTWKFRHIGYKQWVKRGAVTWIHLALCTKELCPGVLTWNWKKMRTASWGEILLPVDLLDHTR